MALDARTRSSLYGKFAEILGDDDANSLMSEFPSVEADELVTNQFLRAELGVTRSELLGEVGSVRSKLLGELGSVRKRARAGRVETAGRTRRVGCRGGRAVSSPDGLAGEHRRRLGGCGDRRSAAAGLIVYHARCRVTPVHRSP